MLVTAPGEAEAANLCRDLVEEGLVACGNIVGGVRSIYRWEGQLQDEAEVLLILKTASSKVSDLLARVPEIHPYQVPEVLVLSVESGYERYLDWVREETRS